jgi:hypothetical protein
MLGDVDDQQVQSVAPGVAGEPSVVDLVIGVGEPQRVGRFKFFLDEQRWDWSDAVARMHGYEPGTVVPTLNCCCSTNIPTIAHVSLSS